MAELGQSSDPRALVPGDADAVRDTIRQLTVYGDALHNAGAGLRRIDTTEDWSGQAADAFRAFFHGQPSRWLDAGDAFHDASSALDGYVSTLIWAQRQAAEAIRLWNEGQAATLAAHVRHDQAVQQAEQHALAATAVGIPTVAPQIPFIDPGEIVRTEARDTLNRARIQLRGAGDTAADAIGRARDKAPPKPSFWQRVGNIVDGAGDELVRAGEDALGVAASVGNAIVHDPADTLLTAAGIALATASAGGETLGVVLDATGVGAVGGVPLNVASAAGIAAGATMAVAGADGLAHRAAGEDRVSMHNGDDADGGPPEPAGEPPTEISGRTNHGNEQALGRDGHGVSDAAMNDAVRNPIQPPEPQPGGRFKYVGDHAVVVLNSSGKVVTTWAKSSAGWRNP